MCLYVEHNTSGSTKDELYAEPTKWKTLVRYNRQRPKIPRLFESFPDDITAAFKSKMLEPTIEAVVQMDEQPQVVKSRSN